MKMDSNKSKIVGGSNKYRLIEKIGSGAFSHVWKAEVVEAKNNGLKKGELVAIKIMLDSVRPQQRNRGAGDKNEYSRKREYVSDGEQMVIDESTMLAKLSKVNTVINYYDKFTTILSHPAKPRTFRSRKPGGKSRSFARTIQREHWCLVVELLGDNLYELVKTVYNRAYRDESNGNDSIYSKRVLPINIVKHITRQIVDAMAAIHAAGIIHTDIKIENILLTKRVADIDLDNPKPSDFEIRVMDFNTSCWNNPRASEYAKQGMEYRSPECILGYRCNEKIDVWSLGCSVFELLTATPLFSLSSNPRPFVFNSDYRESDGNKHSRKEKNKSTKHSKKRSKTSEERRAERRNSSRGGNEDTEDAEARLVHLFKIQSVCGKIPVDEYKQKRYYKYYYRDGDLVYFHPSTIPHRGISEMLVNDYKFNDDDSKKIDEFLSKCIQWSASQRASAADLLKHEWLNEQSSRSKVKKNNSNSTHTTRVK